MIAYALILELIIGPIQILMAIWKYSRKGKPVEYYQDLQRYGALVTGYFGIWLLASKLPIDWMAHDWSTVATILYVVFIPYALAAYFWRISSKDYIEEIEKLIF